MGDHLTSAIVPVALAALPALAYPQPRSVARALAALTAGPLMIIAGEGNGDAALNRAYRDAGGPTVTLWEIARVGHTGGISTAPPSTSAG